ncbi:MULTISPECIES: ABC transporter permease [Streptomyces]|jgi:oligopeptide transport system permease protein|uniref:ABC transporter permease n=1 Tax=Streptomyces albidoflavus TaxID=1886 RepID=A0A8G2E3S8_9ACTN|nr:MULTISPECIES: ABC transporter permease [Streptomyces]QLA56722.1 ABC transporter permease [Streptomyces violascens]SCD88376.1 peptide/nickel transport system permease protein/oligopeptide transport system permease protein [Streptomyces sp. IgraMP-1]AWL34544.1 ABC transporter permease [Streptomyces sp. SM17]MCX4440422.1 ABC transporter permease [Streptomyces albidoflavus]MEE1726554.1 ABC transporter permease [Streptomyces sp. JV186]
MGRYVARRLLQMIPVFIGSTLLIFLMMFALPGDPVRALAGEQAVDQAQIAALKAELGLDRPILVQYVSYIGNVFQGDFGTQIASQRPISEVILDAYPVTIQLALFAFTFIVVAGILLGVIAGLKPNSIRDRGLLGLTLLLIAVPSFVTGYTAQFVFSFKMGLVPPNVGLEPSWNEMLMPAMVLASLSLAYVARLTRTSIAENLRADYMRTATAKGLPRRRIVGIHLMRNSLIPVVTFLGTDIGSLMGGAIVTEGIFNIKGVGGLIYEALGRREGATVVGVVTIIVIVYLLASLIVDLLYAVLDPRIRYA